MKYGKEYADLLKDSRIPQEWKESAIEYRQLKKLIKNVVDELSSMGLNPEVLHKILRPESTPDNSGAVSPENRRGSDSSSASQAITLLPEDVRLVQVNGEEDGARDGNALEGEDLELEYDSNEEQSTGGRLIATDVRERRPSRFRVRLSSHSSLAETDTKIARPLCLQDGRQVDENALDELEDDRLQSQNLQKLPRRTSTARVKAEYVLAGPSDHPTPQIRLVLSNSPKPDINAARATPQPETLGSLQSSRIVPNTENITDHRGLEGRKRSASIKMHTMEETRVNGSTRRHLVSREETDEDDEDEEDDFDISAAVPDPALNRVHSLQRERSNSRSSPEAVIPTSPRLEKVSEVLSPIWTLTSGADSPGMQSIMMKTGGLQDLSLGEPAMSADAESARDSVAERPTPMSEESHGDIIELPEATDSDATSKQREIIISVPSDVAFFELLCQALNSLSDLHDKQQKLFNEAVKRLCQLISASIRPSTSNNPIKNIRPFAKRLDKSQFSGPLPTEYSKSDLYAWREIFTLWIEAQIFESSSERNRGERSVEEAEARLKAFAAEVVKRGLGDRRTLRRKESREAWEEFLRLNMLLLDLKRFQLANVNAARKILKKHDKRTALTASVGFPQFVRKSLDAHVDINGNINSWTFYNTSLPHVLLASLTDTLLPILPSLDDYMCLICTSIAFKPIRLNCGHLFCVRCLAKMQRAGKAHCPLCRATTVLQADRSSLDTEMMGFMQEWFPLEVKRKQKENELEVAKTDMSDMGLNGQCTVM
ncbi:hypothetical protein NliqN6_4867 [Naganishia liquefaciens]|uniref:SPX domain-containing protein n=1 Tax=Naganishia liquefaciens TaxID=104408 RepID=A0A8H3YG59_9TREE|nr:hypothetical protein NliqN6_4867 [Naganishia liquefaciens]